MDRLITLIQPYFVRWGYLIVFGSTFLENSAFLGVIIPGDAVLLLAGFYAQRKALDLGPVIALAFVGAVIGDTIAYAIGRFGGRRLVDRWGGRFFLPHDRLARFDTYFAEYGMWAVALGRITPVVRTFNTFAAGMSKMSFHRFLIAVTLAAGSWSIAVPVIGYLFSGSLQIVKSYLGWGGAALLVVFAAALYVTYRRMVRRLGPEQGVTAQAPDIDPSA